MKKLLSFIAPFIISTAVYAQPALQWQKCFGGINDEVANCVRKTTDGGYIACGKNSFNNGDVTGNHGFGDFWVVKMSATGSLEWQKSLGGTGDDIASSIIQTSDGGYIVTGYTSSDDGDVTGLHGLLSDDYWVVKLTSTGTISWQKCYGGGGSERATAIQQTTDGGYIVAGYSNSPVSGDITVHHGLDDIWVIKITSTGALTWEKSFGGTGVDVANAIQQTTDGGYIVAGYSDATNGDVTGNHGFTDFWVVKINSSGVITWQKSLGGTDEDRAMSVVQAADGGYVVVGQTQTNNNGDVSGKHALIDAWVVKLNSSGSLQWQKCLGGGFNDIAASVIQASDGNFIIAGQTNSTDGDIAGSHGANEFWVVKVSSSGGLTWQKCYGGFMDEWAKSIQEVAPNSYIVCGLTYSTDGDVSGHHGGQDMWIAKLGGTAAVNSVNATDIVISPNPATNSVTVSGIDKVTIRAYNMFGQVVSEAFNTNTLSLAALPSAMYVIRLYTTDGEIIYQEKLLKQ